MSKLRLSYTLLDLWKRKRIEDAINYYFKLKDIQQTDALLEGKVWDDIIQEEVIGNMRLPEQFGGVHFKEMPSVQLKLVSDLSEDVEMVNVLDLLDISELTFYEFKTGYGKSSFEYLSSGQMDMYALGCFLNDIKITKGISIRYNQYTRKSDWAMKWYRPQEMISVKHRLIEKGREIGDYFRKEGLI